MLSFSNENTTFTLITCNEDDFKVSLIDYWQPNFCFSFFFHSMQLKLILRISFTGKRRLKDLLLQKDNRFCADCAAPDPKWA